MDYKDYIKAGNKVLYVPYNENWWAAEWNEVKSQVVTIGEYRPYYTDGTPDPEPDEYEGCCRVEVEERLEECQLRLDRLFPIEWKGDEVLYDGKVWSVAGYADGHGDCDYDGDTRYCILKDGDGYRVVDEDDVYSPRTIDELDYDELQRLWGDICRGSIYTDDYRNTVDVPDTVAEDGYEEFRRYLVDEYGEDNAEEHDTAKEFADYYHAQLAAWLSGAA